MPKGLDIIKGGGRRSNEPKEIESKHLTNLKQARSKTSKVAWLVLFVVIVAIALGLYWYYQSLQPTKSSNTPAVQGANIALPNPTTTAAAQVLTVQVYNSGAGKPTVDQVISNLQANGYTVTNLNNSQYQYDKTYIWYRANNKAEAEKIAKLLTGRDVVLRESQVENDKTILIYLGQK